MASAATSVSEDIIALKSLRLELEQLLTEDIRERSGNATLLELIGNLQEEINKTKIEIQHAASMLEREYEVASLLETSIRNSRWEER